MQENTLKIWLINPYGPLPSEGWRDYSFITFGKTLAAAGHEVIWWTSNFSHHFKAHRSSGWRDDIIVDRFTVRLVPTPSYRKNVGLGRIWRDVVFAVRTYSAGKKYSAPDVVLFSENPVTMGYAGFALASHHKAAAIFDQMDLWPELIVNAFPNWSRQIVNLLFWPVYWRRRRVFNKLDGVIALAEPYLQSVLNEITAKGSLPNKIIYNGIDVAEFRQSMDGPLEKAVASLFDGEEVNAVFAGSLGPSYDIMNLISVARRLDAEKKSVRIFVAGDGPLRSDVVAAAGELDNFTYLGVLSPTELPKIYKRCDIGLSCYTEKSNVEMPDKFYDYTAAGLAIVNSLSGEVSRWIKTDRSGVQYVPGDADSLYTAIALLADDPAKLNAAKKASAESGLRYDSVGQHSILPNFLECIVATRNSI